MPQVQVIQPIQLQPKRLRVAAYARVSSDSSDQLNSLSVQVDYYTHLIQENPNWDFAGIYADEGISGTSTKHREQFNRLMDDCRAGLIDRVLVKSASRLARNTADALASVREMKSLGVTVVFEKEGFDTETSNGEMILSMICAVAQEESLSISKNLKWGIRKRMQDGTYLNGMSPFGFEKQESQLIPIEREAEIVRYIYSSFLVGVGTVQIAEELNRRYPKENGTWYVSAVRRILMNEKYIGDVHHQKNFTPDDLPLLCQKNSGQLPQYYVQNHHKALVSRQEFEKVQTLLKRKGTERNHQNTCAFSNKLYCAECGSVFSRKVRANGVVVWGCRKHLDKEKLINTNPSISPVPKSDGSMVENPEENPVLPELATHKCIPLAYMANPALMQTAIHYLTGYHFRQEHPYQASDVPDEARQNAFELLNTCLVEMCCTTGTQTYRGSLVTADKILAEISHASNGCEEDGLFPYVEDVLDTFLQAISTRKIKNIPQYMKSLLWTSFATYKLNTINGIAAPCKGASHANRLH